MFNLINAQTALDKLYMVTINANISDSDDQKCYDYSKIIEAYLKNTEKEAKK
jgi:hypothetical protein